MSRSPKGSGPHIKEDFLVSSLNSQLKTLVFKSSDIATPHSTILTVGQMIDDSHIEWG